MEYKRNTNERVKISYLPPIFSHDEIGDEEELPIQPISSIRSSKKLIKPTHDVVKKKKIGRKNRGKKASLPNSVVPIIVVPHENESKIIVKMMHLMMISLYLFLVVMIMIGKIMILLIILEIFLAPTWEIMMIAIVIPLVLFILLMMRMIMLMI